MATLDKLSLANQKTTKKEKKTFYKTDNIGVHREGKHCSDSEIFFSKYNRKLSVLIYIETGIVANQIDQACKDPSTKTWTCKFLV